MLRWFPMEKQQYELSYHLNPNLSSEEVSSRQKDLEGVVVHVGGVVTSSRDPEGRQLEYPITLSTQGKRQDFNESFFGSVCIDVAPDKTHDLTSEVSNIDGILRSVLVRTPKEPEMPVKKSRPLQSVISEEGDSEKKPIAEPVNTDVLDQEIEKLITE